MNITYDKTVDALNVTIRKGRVAKTLEISPEIMLDVDVKGNPLYLEILDAKRTIGEKNFSTLTIGKQSFDIAAFA